MCMFALSFSVWGQVEILSFDKAWGFTGLKAPLGQSLEGLVWLHSCDHAEAVGRGRHTACGGPDFTQLLYPSAKRSLPC